MSNSVTALIATAVATGIYALMTCPAYRAGAYLLSGLALGAIVKFIGVGTIKSFFFELVGRDESMSGRDTLWADVFNAGMKSPVFGSGYGAFWYEGRGRELTGTWNPRQAHNAYIDVFVDIGVLGLLLVLAVVHYRLLGAWQRHAGRRGTRRRNAVAAFVSMALGLCFVGAFGESFLLKLDKFQFFVLFWGVMVLENSDENDVSAEFDELERQHPLASPQRHKRPLVSTAP
ncbi:MAG: O-antigen ligase family protein [Planctomycetota bacterium]